MKPTSLLALLLAAAGWVLLIAAGTNMLSGHFDTRTCQTACVSSLFWGAAAAGGLGLLLSVIGLAAHKGRGLAALALVVALPLCGVFAGIVGIGVTQS
jgi:hypothetical protein